MSKLRIAVLVTTCDKYSDVWETLAQGIEKYLKQMPWPLFCVVESSEVQARLPKHWTPLRVPSGGSWSSAVAEAVRQLEAFDYVLMWIDDLIPTAPPRPDLFGAIEKAMLDLRPNYLRLHPDPPPIRVSYGLSGWNLGPLPAGDIYRASTMLTIWKRSVLSALLSPGENAWQFELEGSVRSDSYDGFYSVCQPSIEISNLIIKGVLDPRSLHKLHRAGLSYRAGSRPVMTQLRLWLQVVNEVRSRLTRFIPRRVRRRLQLALWNYR